MGAMVFSRFKLMHIEETDRYPVESEQSECMQRNHVSRSNDNDLSDRVRRNINVFQDLLRVTCMKMISGGKQYS